MSDVRYAIAVSEFYREEVFTKEAEAFLTHLQRKFNPRRKELLETRMIRQKELDVGKGLNFLESTQEVRESAWQVVDTPKDLLNRKVEITGPVDAKMIINALNSGAKVFMADLEDANSPTWNNILSGQVNLKKAVRRTLSFQAENGKSYDLGKNLATLVVRPRGWHLEESNILLDEKPFSGSLVDFGLYFFHNAKELISRGSGPYFYLPKMESHLEARLWNDVFVEAQKYLGIPQKTIRATVLIETLPAAFEMEEILYELRDHAAGLNAGRWDYIFSMIKRLRAHKEVILPDRQQVTMLAPFMRSYSQLLVKTCHRRGAHAIGGMAAFIPSRNNPEVNEKAITNVRHDKEREVTDGFDGTWVAHPDLVPIAMSVFDAKLGAMPHQKHVVREDLKVTARELINTKIPESFVSETGIRTNISVAIQYIEKWLEGLGAVAINNLMEDAATAEISRAQLWQWVHHHAHMKDGRTLTKELYTQFKIEEVAKLQGTSTTINKPRQQAIDLLDQLVLNFEFTEFLTLPAYKLLETVSSTH